MLCCFWPTILYLPNLKEPKVFTCCQRNTSCLGEIWLATGTFISFSFQPSILSHGSWPPSDHGGWPLPPRLEYIKPPAESKKVEQHKGFELKLSLHILLIIWPLSPVLFSELWNFWLISSDVSERVLCVSPAFAVVKKTKIARRIAQKEQFV